VQALRLTLPETLRIGRGLRIDRVILDQGLVAECSRRTEMAVLFEQFRQHAIRGDSPYSHLSHLLPSRISMGRENVFEGLRRQT
jgi:hypothetical protein